jgi:hypothetical protein
MMLWIGSKNTVMSIRRVKPASVHPETLGGNQLVSEIYATGICEFFKHM